MWESLVWAVLTEMAESFTLLLRRNPSKPIKVLRIIAAVCLCTAIGSCSAGLLITSERAVGEWLVVIGVMAVGVLAIAVCACWFFRPSDQDGAS